MYYYRSLDGGQPLGRHLISLVPFLMLGQMIYASFILSAGASCSSQGT